MEVLHLVGSLMEHFLKGFGKLTQMRSFGFVTLFIWVNVPICLDEAIPSRIKAPAS